MIKCENSAVWNLNATQRISGGLDVDFSIQERLVEVSVLERGFGGTVTAESGRQLFPLDVKF